MGDDYIGPIILFVTTIVLIGIFGFIIWHYLIAPELASQEEKAKKVTAGVAAGLAAGTTPAAGPVVGWILS